MHIELNGSCFDIYCGDGCCNGRYCNAVLRTDWRCPSCGYHHTQYYFIGHQGEISNDVAMEFTGEAAIECDKCNSEYKTTDHPYDDESKWEQVK